jgi:hypothetical protein
MSHPYVVLLFELIGWYRTMLGEVEQGWRKSSYSMAGNGDCVEAASTVGRVGVRDSKDQNGPVITYSAAAWQEFLTRTKRENGI